MAVLVDGINPFCIKAGRAPNDSVDLISLRKKKFSQIGTVLAGNTSDQSTPSRHQIIKSQQLK
jgi:hypothetical protein